ncbi:SREBP regulating gene protein isoform X1 [Opisthocomus hoazin]|uniref:SREBP regulating gene protein isoform X1 n=1 Tax=Opisthocomus hoazin TaxID=30419 RepID=UPI003F536E3F
MVPWGAVLWRRLLRKRWVLAIVFGLSLVYFLGSTLKQEERTVRDRNLLQVQEHEQPIVWKVKFSSGNGSQLSNQCRNSVQGKLLITDELGYICERKDLLVNGCCNVNVPSTKLHSCDSCLPNGCCSVYEYCVSCCLQPNKQHLLERFLNRAAIAFQNLFMAVEDRFELCLAKCRTSSQQVIPLLEAVIVRSHKNQPNSDNHQWEFLAPFSPRKTECDQKCIVTIVHSMGWKRHLPSLVVELFN